jgi:hypothetical protein
MSSEFSNHSGLFRIHFPGGTVFDADFFSFYPISDEKYRMLMCLVRLLLDPVPFFASRIVL